MAPQPIKGKGKPFKGAGKKIAPTPAVLMSKSLAGKAGSAKSKAAAKAKLLKKKKDQPNPLFEKRPRDNVKPRRDWAKRDLTRFTKWPRYITLQRQKSLLLARLKVPPPINQFNKKLALDAHRAREILALLNKYRPETKVGRTIRLKKIAKDQAAGKDVLLAKKAPFVISGINKVVTQVQQKKAKLVVIAHDVDPIEIVIFLPALCRKMGVPYCILKSKARLGTVVRRKTCTAVCINEVDSADKSTLSRLCDSVRSHYNDRYDDVRKRWGGGALSKKALALRRKIEKLKIKELKKAEKAAATM